MNLVEMAEAVSALSPEERASFLSILSDYFCPRCGRDYPTAYDRICHCENDE